MRNVRWLAILAALLTGCTGSATPIPTAPDVTSTSTTSTSTSAETTTPSTAASDDTTLRVGTIEPIDSLDPADTLALSDWEILHAIGEGLLRRQPGDGELVPGIAAGTPELSGDGATYTFQLRPDVTFADGLPLTAPLYAESIERVSRLGGRGSDLVSLFVANVEAPDDETLIFRLHEPVAFFPTLVASAAYLPTHPDVYPDEELAPVPATPVYGVGPWYIETLSESEVMLQANPHYFGEQEGPGRVVIRVFETMDELADALTAGDIDVIWRGVNEATAASMSTVTGVRIEAVAGGTMHFLTVNHSLPPTDDVRVRRALAELIDRQAISDAVLGGAFVPAFSPVPPGYEGSSDVYLDQYGEPDVAAAIELLTEAGFTDAEPAEIELAYPPEQFGLDIAAAMEEIELQMEATGLIEVTLTAQPWATYVGDVVEGVYNVAFLGWLHDYPDTHNYLAPFVVSGGLGGSGENLESPEMADLVVEAASEFNQERRRDLYEQVQTLFADDVVTIPLWIEHPYIAYRDDVAGSEEYAHAESLNVGTDMQLDFRTVAIGDG